jgi:CRISPR/Cas system CSM-associated protein Csm2 small subunit
MKQYHNDVPWTKVKDILAKAKNSKANIKKYGWKNVTVDVKLHRVETKNTHTRSGDIKTVVTEYYNVIVEYEV